ncbi:hypothetical protein CONLIGDRAFT_718762 [Coniochaeta ligniaria NRRL 30616]|uniref:Uncharacterized protein n=1 Tax=Coniochaeta ligniaria NRRL 30616 TaxID=1408157 RepID=A0A1J7IRR5_9PEZI|nr:hypothetical protein CONLIGDRAFT_718762 [Coniochaeta ligniaria NRRL 30616]
MAPSDTAITPGKMETFPFTKLPPEVRNIVQFKSGLDRRAGLALRIALQNPDEEFAIMHDFLLHDAGNASVNERVLAVLQTIYHTGATKGSADWASYAACKQELYDNPDLKIDQSRLGITYKDWEDVIRLDYWVCFIINACDFNWHMWGAEAEDEDDFYFRTQGTADPFHKTSNTEIQRITLAVHQFKAYCSLLQQQPHVMSFDQAALLAENFFRNLTPWEKEQLVSIPEISNHIYYEDVALLIENYDFFESRMDKTYFNLLIDPVCKRLIRFIEEKAGVELDKASTKMVLVGVMSSQWHEYPPFHILNRVANLSEEEEDDIEYEYIFDYEPILTQSATWSALLQMWAWSQAEEDLAMVGCEGLEDSTTANQDAYSRLLNLEHDRDRDNGPQESWKRWYVRFRHEDRQFFASRKLWRLRSTGYVFWDKQRMRRHWTATGRFADEFSDTETETSSQAEVSDSAEASLDEQALSDPDLSSGGETLSEAEGSSEGETANDTELLSDGEASSEAEAFEEM